MNRNPASHFSSSLNVTVVLCICVGWSTVETRDALQMWAILLPGSRLFYCNWAGACEWVCVCSKINTSTLAVNKALLISSRSKEKFVFVFFLFVTDNHSICLLIETINDNALWISKNTVGALCYWQNELFSYECYDANHQGRRWRHITGVSWRLTAFICFSIVEHMNQNDSLCKWDW